MSSEALALALAAAGLHAAWNLALARRRDVPAASFGAFALASPLLGESVGSRRLAGAARAVVGIAVLGAT